MTQRIFDTQTSAGQAVQVMIGWDRPLKGYFLNVYLTNVPEDEDDLLFTNLELPPAESHPKSVDPFIAVLTDFGISVPDTVVQDLVADKDLNRGNVMTTYDAQGGVLSHFE